MHLRRALLVRYFQHRTRRRFARVLAHGLERLAPWSPGGDKSEPLLLVANHSSWWDAMMPVLISLGELHHDAYALMDRTQYDRYPVFRHLGVLPLDRDNPRAAMKSLQAAADLLRDSRRVLWIFPQGKITPNDARPIVPESGAARLAGMLGGCHLAPVAFRYELGRDELPVAYMSVGEVVEIRSRPVKETHNLISSLLTEEVDLLRERVLSEKLDGFESMLTKS